MKKILFLGGAPSQIAPIKYALEQGHYVITCDYLPENPGHKLAHEYFNISTIDYKSVLEMAKNENIDGVVAYASDPAAPTAAYVAEKLNLPGNPYESVLTLSRKDLFRNFLAKNGFSVPRSKSFYEISDAYDWLTEICLPVFVKPVDSSGSKGVTELNDIEQFDKAFNYALTFSVEKKVIVEEKIQRIGNQVAGDGFVVSGELVFRCWANENFDSLCNGLVPIGQTFPTTHSERSLNIVHSETQRLLDLLGIKQGALNFDFVFSDNESFYFLELGPRNGGCRIPEVVRYATGVDLIKYTVDIALGLNCSDLRMQPVNGYWASYMVHALEDGIFKGLTLSEKIKGCIIEQQIYVHPGDAVRKFSGSNDTLGECILRFDSMEDMQNMIRNMENHIYVEIDK